MLNTIRFGFVVYFKNGTFKFNICSPASEMEILP